MLARSINHIEEAIISLLLVSMTLLVFVEVVMRFVFTAGALWIQELTLHMSAWMVLFGASYGIKVGCHIGVDAVVRLLDPNVRRIVTIFAVFLCLVYCALYGYGAWIYLAKVYSISIELEDMAIQKWVAHSILLIGFVLLAVRFLELFWSLYTGKQTGFVLADEARDALEDFDLGEKPAINNGEGSK